MPIPFEEFTAHEANALLKRKFRVITDVDNLMAGATVQATGVVRCGKGWLVVFAVIDGTTLMGFERQHLGKREVNDCLWDLSRGE